MDTEDTAPPELGISRSESAYPDDQPSAANTEQPSPEQPQAKDQPNRSAQAEIPDTSEYQLRMPDWVRLDAELLTSAVPLLKEAGISSDQAEKLVPFVTQVQERFQQTQLDYFSELRKSWNQEARADHETGGENWNETMRLAGVALRAGGAADMNHETRQVLNESGVGDHPAMIRLFRNIGRRLELMSRQTGISPRLSVIDAARQAHQKGVYPNDPENRPFSVSGEQARRARASRSRPDNYPKDEPNF